MFSFFKKKKQISILPPSLLVDIHSHLIPSIDDGAKTMAESLLLLEGLEELGYTKVITTPHIMIDTYHNTKSSILQALVLLQETAKRTNISLSIEAAAEYYLDEGLLALIKNDDVLLINNTYLLFETSYTHRPAQLEEIIFEILTAGHTPLLAHPERYRYIRNFQKEYSFLKGLGVEFQVNLNSLNGYYGSEAKKKALFLSQNGFIDFLGSDTHNIKQVDNLKAIFADSIYKDIHVNNIIKNNTLLKQRITML